MEIARTLTMRQFLEDVDLYASSGPFGDVNVRFSEHGTLSSVTDQGEALLLDFFASAESCWSIFAGCSVALLSRSETQSVSVDSSLSKV